MKNRFKAVLGLVLTGVFAIAIAANHGEDVVLCIRDV